MTLNLNDLVSLGALIGSAYAIYTTIKKTGAAKMKTDKDIETLNSEVSDLKTRLAVSDSCNTNNDKTIGEMKVDIAWIKSGISEIKDLIQKKG